jgi:hypothetical protein
MLLDFVGTVILTAVIVVNIVALVSVMDVPRRWRLILASVLGMWIGLQVALTSVGAYATETPYIGISVVLPLVAALVAIRALPELRAALMGAPTALLVGLNVSRVFGAFFLLLAASGRLGGPFPQSAGWGDVATGVLAVPVAIAVVRGSRRYLGAWNAFGALDLIAAVALGLLSANGPLQLIDAGTGSGAIATLPWALIPTVLVPFYLIIHGVIFLQQRETSTGHARAPGLA